MGAPWAPWAPWGPLGPLGALRGPNPSSVSSHGALPSANTSPEIRLLGFPGPRGPLGGRFSKPGDYGWCPFSKISQKFAFWAFLGPKWWFRGPKWRFQARFLVMGRCLRQTPPQKSDFWDFQAQFRVMRRCLRQTPPQKSDFCSEQRSEQCSEHVCSEQCP